MAPPTVLQQKSVSCFKSNYPGATTTQTQAETWWGGRDKTVSSTSVKSNRRMGWTADKKLHCPHYTRELRRCPAEGEAEKGDGQCLFWCNAYCRWPVL